MIRIKCAQDLSQKMKIECASSRQLITEVKEFGGDLLLWTDIVTP